MKHSKLYSLICLCFFTLSCSSIVSIFDDVYCVWDGSSGFVPDTTATPTGFTVSPSEAQTLTVLRFPKRKNVWHIYADSKYYYVVDGYFGSNSAGAKKNGYRISGKSTKPELLNEISEQLKKLKIEKR